MQVVRQFVCARQFLGKEHQYEYLVMDHLVRGVCHTGHGSAVHALPPILSPCPVSGGHYTWRGLNSFMCSHGTIQMRAIKS